MMRISKILEKKGNSRQPDKMTACKKNQIELGCAKNQIELPLGDSQMALSVAQNRKNRHCGQNVRGLLKMRIPNPVEKWLTLS